MPRRAAARGPRIPARLRVEVVARACQRIAIAVDKGALGDVLGSAGSENVQGEVQKKLDVISNWRPRRVAGYNLRFSPV